MSGAATDTVSDHVGESAGSPEAGGVPERILLFIPMYNCETQITRVIGQLSPDIQSLLAGVIVINNRSTDNGQQAAAAALASTVQIPSAVLLNADNYGLGGSHKVALNYAHEHGFDYCIVLHGDDQGSIADLAPLLRRGEHRNVDCLLGARFMRGSGLKGYSVLRTFGNHVFNLIYSISAGRVIHDLGSGLNLYRMSALKDRAYLKCADDLTFNYHMILRSIAAGHRIRFFPLEWREDDQVSNVKLVRQSLRVLAIARDYFFVRNQYLSRSFTTRAPDAYRAAVVYSNAFESSASAANP